MIAGASVEPGARITREQDRIRLNDLKIGQTVEITYIKNEQGLLAQSIRVRSR